MNRLFKNTLAGIFLLIAGVSSAQNLVPNPSFEDTLGCMFSVTPQIDCLDKWNESVLNIPAFNTPDLCFNGAVFFPPSSIPAFDGTKYIGLDCQPMNSEYVQVELNQSMQAGKSYCVSFYVSVCDQTTTPAVSLGAYFSNGILNVNPFVGGLSAHVQGAVPTDPTIWTKIAGVYTATGGEDHITLGGFENSGQPAFVYMYIDMVEVYELPDEQVFQSTICPNQTVLLTATAPATATSLLWNTNETTSSIIITTPGIYWVEKTIGSCTIIDTFFVNVGSCVIDTTIVIVEPTEMQTLYAPNAFTPNGDGLNDVWSVYGENLTDLKVSIYNRWGEMIFSAEQVNFVWDGTAKSQMVEVGVYVYEILFRNENGIIQNKKGRISLLR